MIMENISKKKLRNIRTSINRVQSLSQGKLQISGRFLNIKYSTKYTDH